MVVVPGAIPETNPLLSIVATAGLEDAHGFTGSGVPLPDKEELAPLQTVVFPEMAGVPTTWSV